MIKQNLPYFENIHTFIFDFDGIFTNNKVIISSEGEEFVICDRGDGLAFNLIRKFMQNKNWDLNMFILSKEKNKVVESRAKKLKINCYKGIDNKKDFITKYLVKNFGNSNSAAKGIIYFGNDINDYYAMKLSGFSVAPIDSHPLILDNADLIIPNKGGEGFIRAFIEKFLKENGANLLELI